MFFFFFFFNDTATTEIYTLSLHDALPILSFLSLRMRPCALVPVKWRLPECMRTTLPVAVILKRLAAPRWVLSFIFGLVEFLGIAILCYSLLNCGAAALRPTNLQLHRPLPRRAAYAGCAACCELGLGLEAPFFGANKATRTLPSM